MSKNASILWSDFNLNLSQPELGQRFFKQLFKLETVPSKGRLSELVSGKNWGKSYKILELLARTTRDLESGTLSLKMEEKYGINILKIFLMRKNAFQMWPLIYAQKIIILKSGKKTI